MSGDLNLDVYVSDYKPIPGDLTVMSTGQATWSAGSVSLLSGERDAVRVRSDSHSSAALTSATSPVLDAASAGSGTTTGHPEPCRRLRALRRPAMCSHAAYTQACPAPPMVEVDSRRDKR
jgi:hypothetical protein